jgi:hypothetical protein
VPRERSLADVMRAVDAAMESEGDLRLPWAKPLSRSEPLLSSARVPEPAAKMSPSELSGGSVLDYVKAHSG